MLKHLNVYLLLPPAVSNTQVQHLVQTPPCILIVFWRSSSPEFSKAHQKVKKVKHGNSEWQKWGIKAGTDILQLDFTVRGWALPVWWLNHCYIYCQNSLLPSLGLSFPVHSSAESHSVCKVGSYIYRSSVLKFPAIFNIILFCILRTAVCSFCVTFNWKVVLHYFYFIPCL